MYRCLVLPTDSSYSHRNFLTLLHYLCQPTCISSQLRSQSVHWTNIATIRAHLQQRWTQHMVPSRWKHHQHQRDLSQRMYSRTEQIYAFMQEKILPFSTLTHISEGADTPLTNMNAGFSALCTSRAAHFAPNKAMQQSKRNMSDVSIERTLCQWGMLTQSYAISMTMDIIAQTHCLLASVEHATIPAHAIPKSWDCPSIIHQTLTRRLLQTGAKLLTALCFYFFEKCRSFFGQALHDSNSVCDFMCLLSKSIAHPFAHIRIVDLRCAIILQQESST